MTGGVVDKDCVGVDRREEAGSGVEDDLLDVGGVTEHGEDDMGGFGEVGGGVGEMGALGEEGLGFGRGAGIDGEVVAAG